MNDSELRYIANQVAASNRQLIIDEIDRRFRMPTGVQSGGPFDTFSVNDQGQIIDARVGGTSVGSGAHIYLDAGVQNSNNYITWSGIIYDTSSYWAAGRNYLTAPVNGYYLVSTEADWALNTTGDRELHITHATSTGTTLKDEAVLTTKVTAATTAMRLALATIVKRAAGTRILVYAGDTSGGTLGLSGSSDGYSTHVKIHLLHTY
jgi:hypothetical protein